MRIREERKQKGKAIAAQSPKTTKVDPDGLKDIGIVATYLGGRKTHEA